MISPSPKFTAARIAAALGDVSRQAVQKRMKRGALARSTPVPVNGQLVAAWPVQAIPADYYRRLATVAKRGGYRDVDHLLSDPSKQWEPGIAMGQLAPACIQKAAERRQVLAPILRECGETANLSELARTAHAALVHLPGSEFKDERTVRRWIETALLRDRGRGEYERLQLYLPDRLAKSPTASPARRALLAEATVLREALALIPDPLNTTLQDRKHLWVAAMDEIDGRLAQGESTRNAHTVALDALEGSGIFLSISRRALARTMLNKRQRWIAGGRQASALEDHRPERSGNHRAPIVDEPTRELLLARNVGNDGRASQTWREMWDDGKLPPDFYRCYSRGEADKSRVPKRIRDLLRDDTRNLRSLHQGPRENKLRGPKCTRDWSQMPSGIQAQSDDCTLPVYFWVQLEDGSFKLLRGQFLPWIDTRTSYIYCFQLLPKESYSSLDIMRGLVRLNDEFGLPEELYFERGIWQSSTLISGRSGEVSWKERAYGLRDLGIRLIHALDPSAKIIENVLGKLQNRMERERGYCGRNERDDCPESLQKAKRLVESGKMHPGQAFYSYAEWVKRLEGICDAYNDEPQDGKRLAGMSPRTAFVKLQQAPPMRLDDSTRYLLATHRRVETVRCTGLTVKIGKTPYTYKSEATGQLVGKKVLVWFDIEDPSLVTITSLGGKNPVTVPRETVLPAWRAPSGLIAQAKRENAAHQMPIRQLYSTLKKDYPEEMGRRSARPVFANDSTRALGKEMQEQKAAIKGEMARVEKTRRAVLESARKAGLQLPVTNDPRQLAGQRKLAELMRTDP